MAKNKDQNRKPQGTSGETRFTQEENQNHNTKQQAQGKNTKQ